MIQAFREIEIPVQLKDRQITVTVPFTVELMERVEQTIEKASKRTWFRTKAGDNTIVQAFQDFCKPYLPHDFDYSKADPTFFGVFFSRVRGELNHSIEKCLQSEELTPAS